MKTKVNIKDIQGKVDFTATATQLTTLEIHTLEDIINTYGGNIAKLFSDLDAPEPKQTPADMPPPDVNGDITITNAYINKFITTPQISSGTFVIDYWKSYLETEIHLETGNSVPALNVHASYKRINLPNPLMSNTTYIIAIKNGVITFAKSI